MLRVNACVGLDFSEGSQCVNDPGGETGVAGASAGEKGVPAGVTVVGAPHFPATARRKSAALGLRLTERDLDLLRFLHEQQFASLAYRFFDRSRYRNKLPSIPSIDPFPEN